MVKEKKMVKGFSRKKRQKLVTHISYIL